MYESFNYWFLLLVLSFISAFAAATPINVTAERSVVIGSLSTGDIPGPGSPSSALGVFNDSISSLFLPGSPGSPIPVSSDQTSDIQVGTGLFSGSGNTTVGFSFLIADAVHADSSFDVFFDIAVDHTYILGGTLTASVDGGLGESRFQLLGPTGIDLSITNFGPDVDLTSSGLLTAGNYHLRVFSTVNPGTTQLGGYMGGTTDYDFNFAIQAVTSAPEPTTLALLALGVAVISYRKRNTT